MPSCTANVYIEKYIEKVYKVFMYHSSLETIYQLQMWITDE